MVSKLDLLKDRKSESQQKFENELASVLTQEELDHSRNLILDCAHVRGSLNQQALHQMNSWWMMGLRMALGFLVAVGTGLIVEWQYRKHGNKLLSPLAAPDLAAGQADEENGNPAQPRSIWQRISNISETALHDYVNIIVFLILGAFLASATRQGLRFYGYEDRVVQYAQTYPVVVIGIMMGLAILLCICSEADAFVAASFQALPSAAKLAFLVLGPMLDLKLYMMYTRVFRPRLIWTIITCVVVQVLIYSTITYYAWERLGPVVAPASFKPVEQTSPGH